jgi:hypothetical protein
VSLPAVFVVAGTSLILHLAVAGGQGAGRWLHGQALSYASRGLSCRPCAARASGAAFWPRSPPEKRAAGAAGVSSERSRRLARPRASSSDRRGSGEK